jgi:hypothetical protein
VPAKTIQLRCNRATGNQWNASMEARCSPLKSFDASGEPATRSSTWTITTTSWFLPLSGPLRTFSRADKPHRTARIPHVHAPRLLPGDASMPNRVCLIGEAGLSPGLAMQWEHRLQGRRGSSLASSSCWQTQCYLMM